MGYVQEIRDWQSLRLKKLLAEDGWTTLVGLFWLDTGDNSFGRAASNRINMEYPGLQDQVGTFRLLKGRVEFNAAPGSRVTQAGKPVSHVSLLADDDAGGRPTLLKTGTLTFYLLKRGNRYGIRVKDSASAVRTCFRGLEYFPIDEQWRLTARFLPFDPVKNVSTVNVLGVQEEMQSPGRLSFQVGGQRYQLEAVLEYGVTDYFVMFGDMTNGRQTYAAGRCLYVSPAVNGETVIDFNKAYNPPCCFTAFATCALPQAQNQLPIAVKAGELKYQAVD